MRSVERAKRHEFEFDSEGFLGRKFDIEEKLEKPSALENASLIERYHAKGSSLNQLFDARVKASCAGLKRTISWIEQHSALKTPERKTSL